MVYELPEEIKYHEKIIFGLKWKQLVKITFYSLIGLAIIKTPVLPHKHSLALAGIITSIGSLLTVTEKDKQVSKILKYASTFNEAGYLDKKAYEFTEIEDIKDDVIVKNNGKRLAILRAKPINLKVKSQAERKHILNNYKKFLNSLDFPITIHVRNVNTLTSLKEYYNGLEEEVLENVEETGNKKMEEYYREQKNYFQNYVEENSSKKRMYYIIIPVTGKTHEKAVEELDHRVNLVQEKIMPVGIETERLRTQELVSFTASFFEEFVEADTDYIFPLTLPEKQPFNSS